MDMISNFLALTFQLAIPIALGGLCGTISERGGVIMLGVEGMMLVGAFSGAYGAFLTGNAMLGVLLSIFVGGLLGLVYAVFCLKFRAHQSVVGVGMNLFASGITAVLLKIVWNSEGMSDFVSTVPNVTIPLLSDIPVLDSVFFNQSPYLYLMLFMIFAVWVVFYKTKIGLRYRAIGDQPVAARTAGIDVNRYRYAALCAAGMLAGLAGSYLSLSQNNLFVADMTAGRGFMGLAACIFGGWHPIGCFAASMVFALAQAARYYFSDLEIPLYFIQMIPYVSTLLILIFVGKKAKMPEALGKLID